MPFNSRWWLQPVLIGDLLVMVEAVRKKLSRKNQTDRDLCEGIGERKLCRDEGGRKVAIVGPVW